MNDKTNGPMALQVLDVGQGEPVLLLHGLGSRGSDWDLQLPGLREHYRVIVPDLRGHGASPKPPGPYSLSAMAADVVALLARLESGPVHVVGLSMGGMIGFQLTVDQPVLVRSLVVVNSTPDLVPRTAGERWQIARRRWLARLMGPARTGRFLAPRLFPKPEQAAFREMLVTEWATNDKAAYVAALEACLGWSVLGDVGSIRCPVLVISGDRDYLPLDAKRAYTALIPGAELVIITDSGHATPIDQAEQFNELLLSFLARARSAPSQSNPNQTMETT
jgi:pimeloyl-ACP methyl ester carboxylesterase